MTPPPPTQHMKSSNAFLNPHTARACFIRNGRHPCLMFNLPANGPSSHVCFSLQHFHITRRATFAARGNLKIMDTCKHRRTPTVCLAQNVFHYIFKVPLDDRLPGHAQTACGRRVVHARSSALRVSGSAHMERSASETCVSSEAASSVVVSRLCF